MKNEIKEFIQECMKAQHGILLYLLFWSPIWTVCAVFGHVIGVILGG